MTEPLDIMRAVVAQRNNLAEAADLDAEADTIVYRTGMTGNERAAARDAAAGLRQRARELRGTN